jgi:hypothetical protein
MEYLAEDTDQLISQLVDLAIKEGAIIKDDIFPVTEKTRYVITTELKLQDATDFGETVYTMFDTIEKKAIFSVYRHREFKETDEGWRLFVGHEAKNWWRMSEESQNKLKELIKPKE